MTSLICASLLQFCTELSTANYQTWKNQKQIKTLALPLAQGLRRLVPALVQHLVRHLVLQKVLHLAQYLQRAQ